MALAVTVISATSPVFAEDVGVAVACDRAGLEAEHNADLPNGLLRAIGSVESGRLDPLTGRTAAWPWTINAMGNGRLFGSLHEAVAEARALQQRGVTSVDVGCFQINLQYHPGAFNSLEQAFDPSTNAAYAARFLSVLRTKTGSWENAVSAYHSATPQIGAAYRDKVMAGWTSSGNALVVSTPPPIRVVIWTQPLATEKMRIWRPDSPGAAPSVIVIRQLSKAASRQLETTRLASDVIVK